MFGHMEHLRRCAHERSQPSFLFRIPGFLLKHVCIDSMHAGDLGTFADVVGSLFFMEVDCKLWFQSRKLGLQHLNAKLESFYQAHQVENLARVYPLSI